MTRHCFAALACALFLILPSVAAADIISPAQESCSGKEIGDACTVDGEDGTCSKGERCRPTPGGTEDCSETVVCKKGAPAETTPASETTPANETTPDSETTPAKTDTPSKSDDGKGSDKNGCQQASGAAVPMGSFLLGFVLLGLSRRRRD